MEDFGGAWALSRFEDIWNAHLGSYKDYTSVEGTSPPEIIPAVFEPVAAVLYLIEFFSATSVHEDPFQFSTEELTAVPS